MIEVWNGPMRPTNLRGIAWWLQLLAQGRHIAAVGGSDFHRDRQPVRLANPVTAVYAADPGAQSILSAAQAGHSYITCGVNGPRLALRCGEASFGDTVPADAADKTVCFSAKKLPCGAVLKLITADENGNPIPLAQAKRSGRRKASGIFVPTEKPPRFALLLASITLPFFGEYPLAISNPIRFE